MILCHCLAVTDGAIAAAIAAGARDVGEISRSCGAGSRCRACWPALRALLDEHDRLREPRRHHPAA